MTTHHCENCAVLAAERDLNRAGLEKAQADLSALVDRMPLSTEAQHAYESGLMARADQAEAEASSLRAQVAELTKECESLDAEVIVLRGIAEDMRDHADEGIAAKRGAAWDAVLASTEQTAAEHDEKIRREVLEEAAKIAEAEVIQSHQAGGLSVEANNTTARTLAARYRALAEQKPETPAKGIP